MSNPYNYTYCVVNDIGRFANDMLWRKGCVSLPPPKTPHNVFGKGGRQLIQLGDKVILQLIN